MVGVELDKLRLPREERPLSPLPQVNLIAISSPPLNEDLRAIQKVFAERTQDALKDSDFETAQENLGYLEQVLAGETEARQLGSSPTIHAGASALTCYSEKGLIYPQDSLDPRHCQKADQVVESTRKAGHLTTRQHTELTFGLANISRQVIWSFLHAHPFYNSEQVSQRYVTMQEGNFFIPPLEGQALDLYRENADEQIRAYQDLKQALTPVAAEEYYRLFPEQEGSGQSAIEKRVQEIARYAVGVDSFAYMWHTINTLTLMRYWRTCQIADVPQETKLIVSQMVAEVARIDPNFLKEFDSDSFSLEETPEYRVLTSLGRKVNQINPAAAKRFIKEFDDPLGDYQSKLMAWTITAPQVIGDSVRSVLGATIKEISDEEAIAYVLDPGFNRLLGDVLNLTTMSKLSRALNHVSYVFRKRISHTADSQDQRHRMVPADRPFLAAHYSGKPDYITPVLIEQSPEALVIYKAIMKKTFAAINRLLEMGVKPEYALYRLPNSFPIRFTGSGSLLNLHHKYSARLCYTAQEEIWRVSREEAQQITELHPLIGQWLLAPCGQRMAAHVSPFCPEGKRYCGQPIWEQKGVQEYPDRLI